MSQQLSIGLMVDVAAAIKANTLKGHSYMFDNMKLQGSKGVGTGHLVSAVNGTHFFDGSQANEQVLNWVSIALGSPAPTLPKTFHSELSKNSDLQGLQDYEAFADRNDLESIEEVINQLKAIGKKLGTKTKTKSKHGKYGKAGLKIIDVMGDFISPSEETISDVSSSHPIITDITGEAVDKKIIYLGQYGSPELVTDGWYWSASVDTSKPGTYAYTMHVQLHKLSLIDLEWTWVPVNMTCEAYIKVSTVPKVNGFTGAGVSLLPIPMDSQPLKLES